MEYSEIPPKWKLVAFDESDYVDKSTLQKIGGKLYSVYAYDAASVTHLCEVTPSYEMYVVAAEGAQDVSFWNALDEDGSEAVADTLADVLFYSEPVTYMHCSTVDRRASLDLSRFLDDDATDDDVFELVHAEGLASAACDLL